MNKLIDLNQKFKVLKEGLSEFGLASNDWNLRAKNKNEYWIVSKDNLVKLRGRYYIQKGFAKWDFIDLAYL